jgi:hypothetical protein
MDDLKYTDSQLQQAVLTELSWEPSVGSAHIGVVAKAGVVTLTGHVKDYAEKHAAERAAKASRRLPKKSKFTSPWMPCATMRILPRQP